MPKLIVEITLALALTAGALLSLAAGALADVDVKSAYARASATPSATSASVYLTIANMGPSDRLVSISTPLATAMLHETEEVEGVITMRHLDGLDIPAKGKVMLSPGGRHVMLTGLSKPLKPGDMVPLRLIFENAGQVDISVPVAGVAQDGPLPGD